MAFARLLRSLTRDPGIGRRIVPIVSDEARTFGLESLISEVQIYAPDGQRYTPVDAGLALHYAESATGQILEEGITETGRDRHLHRRGHLVRHLGRVAHPLLPLLFDVRLPAGRRPALGPRGQPGPGVPPRMHGRAHHLNGEGLQHQDGHSLLLASAYPSVAAYDPAFAYEVATIMEDGIRRMTGPEAEDRYWYLTLYNENYVMPALPG